MRKSGFAHIFLVVLLFGVVLAGGYLYINYLENRNPQATINTNPTITNLQTKVSPTPSPASANSDLTLIGPESYKDTEYFTIKGELRKIASISGLINYKLDSGFGSGYEVDPPNYFEAGIFQNGPLAGYKRIVLAVPQIGMGVWYQIYFFATVDNKEYVLLDNSGKVLDRSRVKEIGGTNLGYTTQWSMVNFSKIKKVAVMPPTVPRKMVLNSSFQLVNPDINFETKELEISKNVYKPSVELFFNQNQYRPLADVKPEIKLFEKKINEVIDDPKKQRILSKYILSNTNVYAKDNSGLSFVYRLTWSGQQNAENSISYLDFPGEDFQTNGKKFSEYSSVLLMGGGCGGVRYFPIVSELITPELEKVGSLYWQDMYAPKSSDNELLWLQWMAKFENQDLIFSPPDMEKNLSLEAYFAKQPVLFFRDYWNRWVAVGEGVYGVGGGCAKPVIYLYPEKPTSVSLRFTGQMSLDIAIPSYDNGWKVLAQPDGKLTDLQSEKTDCNKINFGFGSEYATQACQKNSYPYLYWAGQAYNYPYPHIISGWTVDREELYQYIDEKLNKIGLNSTERGDFLEYWVPKLLSHPEPYFRIAFLSTDQMNKIAPMEISPRPDTVFRIFMDFEPLKEKKEFPAPKEITPLLRQGFTVVEWGGLKN